MYDLTIPSDERDLHQGWLRAGFWLTIEPSKESPMSAEPIITKALIDDQTLEFDLADGRTITAPLAWFRRLHSATPEQRANHVICGGGAGVHWPDLDEDIGAAGLLRAHA